MSRRRPRGRPIHGWLSIDKPHGMTSTQVVSAVKRITDAQKVGHGGTLDPLATGVLPVALGEATKTVQYVMDAPKAYRFTIRLGARTDTDDAEGTVVATSAERPATEALAEALQRFVGEIEQRPPTYAAVKVAGERAYDLARRGETVELAPRMVRIDRLMLVSRPDPDHVVLEMECGKGAYVRALARDLGEALGCLGHVVQLRRTRVGGFSAAESISLEALEQAVANDSLPQVLVPVATALVGIPALAVTEPQADRLRAGQPIVVTPQLLPERAGDGAVLRAMRSGRVVALARLDGPELAPLRVFNW